MPAGREEGGFSSIHLRKLGFSVLFDLLTMNDAGLMEFPCDT